MMRKSHKYLLVSFSLFLTACVSIGPVKQKPDKVYTLNPSVSRTTILPNRTNQVTLLVSNGAAAPGYQSTAMIYTRSDYQLQQFALHRWVAPPAQMISNSLAEGLLVSGKFKAVLQSPPGAQTTNIVVVKLLKLQQNFIDEQHSQEQLSLQLAVLSGQDNRLLALKTFSKTLPSEGNPEAGVVAANQALQLLMPEMVQFIAQTLRV